MLFYLRHSQPVLADEVQTFKALITIHKVLQEGHPIVVREAQQHANWIDSLMRGVGGDGVRGMTWDKTEAIDRCFSTDELWIGYAPLIREYVFFLESKLNFHRNHPEFNGMSFCVERISEFRDGGLSNGCRPVRIRGVH